jgi:peptidoglycan hydrolase-like protein with peptidoglycan-binding domain
MSTTPRSAHQALLLSLCMSFGVVSIQSAKAQDSTANWSSPTLSAEISAGRNLYAGARGAAVSELQAGLKKLGYQITVDGVFGPQTLTFVRDFQRAQGPDRRWHRRRWNLLRARAREPLQQHRLAAEHSSSKYSGSKYSGSK